MGAWWELGLEPPFRCEPMLGRRRKGGGVFRGGLSRAALLVRSVMRMEGGWIDMRQRNRRLVLVD